MLSTQSSDESLPGNAPPSSSESLRTRAKGFFQTTQTSDLSLVWILGEIHATKAYREWGYASFRDWYLADSPGSPSLGHAYALARVGKTFLGQRADIEARFASGELTIRRLIELTARHESGEPLREVVDALLTAERDPVTPLPDTERSRFLRVRLPDGDVAHVLGGLTMVALANTVPTVSEAIQALGIDTYTFGISEQSRFKEYHKYKELILEGKFFCAACNKIPLTPTFHHVLPVSLGRGYGPQALLCWDPCHDQIVQKKWRLWAKRWGLRYGFTVESLQQEADRQINAGDLSTDPTVIIVGKAIGLSA